MCLTVFACINAVYRVYAKFAVSSIVMGGIDTFVAARNGYFIAFMRRLQEFL